MARPPFHAGEAWISHERPQEWQVVQCTNSVCCKTLEHRVLQVARGSCKACVSLALKTNAYDKFNAVRVICAWFALCTVCLKATAQCILVS